MTLADQAAALSPAEVGALLGDRQAAQAERAQHRQRSAALEAKAADLQRQVDWFTAKLSQNSKNAKKSAIFMVAKGQLLTKFLARYVGGHATQTVSLRCHRCPVESHQTPGASPRTHRPPP